jgi:NADP-dependent 3-hydroxy acid dehydrogenase YdfG
VQRVLQDCGRLDVLMSVAGIAAAAPFQNATTTEYHQMVNINILGPLYSSHAALPTTKRQANGHVVLVSTGTGRSIHPSTVNSGTKHVVSAIAQSLRHEICAETSIEPGAVRTELISHMRDDVRQAVEARLGTCSGTDVAAPSSSP